MPAPAATETSRAELPEGYWWRWDGAGWAPDGWCPEAEVTAAGLAGENPLAFQAARIAMAGCARSSDEQAGAAAWTRWIAGRALALPHRHSLAAGLRELLTGDPILLRRALRARHCPLALLHAGLAAGGDLAELALLHPLLPYETRLAVMDPSRVEHLAALAAARTTPLDRLRELASGGQPDRVRLAALDNDLLPEAEAATELLSMSVAAVQAALKRKARRLHPLVLAHSDDPQLLHDALAAYDRPTAEMLRRLLERRHPLADVALARSAAVRADDALASEMTERAWRFLDGGRRSHFGDESAGADLVRAVIANGLWRTPDQQDRILGWMLGLERDSPTRLAATASVSERTVIGLTGRWVLEMAPYMFHDQMAARAIETALDLPGKLVEAARWTPALALAVMRRDPANASIARRLVAAARALGRSQRVFDTLIAAADPAIQPELAEAALAPGVGPRSSAVEDLIRRERGARGA